MDTGAAIQKETVNGGSGKVIRRQGQLAGARGPIPHFAGKGVASACQAPAPNACLWVWLDSFRDFSLARQWAFGVRQVDCPPFSVP